MTANEARFRAEKYLDQLDDKAWRYTFARISESKNRPNTWVVFFEVHHADRTPWSDESMVFVDKKDGSVFQIDML